MNKNQSAAYIMAQVAMALIELEAMKATNTERERNGYALAYTEEDFMKLHEKYQIVHNAVIGNFSPPIMDEV